MRNNLIFNSGATPEDGGITVSLSGIDSESEYTAETCFTASVKFRLQEKFYKYYSLCVSLSQGEHTVHHPLECFECFLVYIHF